MHFVQAPHEFTSTPISSVIKPNIDRQSAGPPAVLGNWGFGLPQSGIVLLVGGFWFWRGTMQGIGWLLIFAAVGAVSRNVLRARRASIHGQVVGLYISLAHSALGAGMTMAFARIGETMGGWRVDRMALLGAVGFGMLSAIGVGSRMLPTFLMGPDGDSRWLPWQLWLTVSSLTMFGVGAVTRHGIAMRVGAAVLLVAVIVTVALTVRWVQRTHRPLDAALWHVMSSFAALAFSLPVGAWLLLGNAYEFARWAALLVALVVGRLTTLIVGVMAKILPHLAYNTLARTRPGIATWGSPNNRLREDWQHASMLLLGAGWFALAVALLLRSPSAAVCAALVCGAGVGVVLANYARVVLLARVPGAAPSQTVTASGRMQKARGW